jgi:hypothetical protein
MTQTELEAKTLAPGLTDKSRPMIHVGDIDGVRPRSVKI